MSKRSISLVSMLLICLMIISLMGGCSAPANNVPQPEGGNSPQNNSATANSNQPTVSPKDGKYGGTVSFVIPSDPANINYLASQGGNTDIQIEMCTSDMLTLYNPATGEYEGRILESWEHNDDATVWTMHVRKGIKWHDGEDLTAHDIVFTKKYLASRDLDILDTPEVNEEEVFEIIDDYTYTVTTPTTNGSEIADWTWIIPEHIWENVPPANFSTAPEGQLMIGCGPFKMTEYKAGEYIRFDRFDDYWGGKPYLDTIYYRIIGDNAAAAAALKSGQVNMITAAAETAEELQNTEGVKIWKGSSGNVNRLYFNLSDPRFQDVRVRQAIAHLMQREIYCEQAMRGFADPAYSDFAPTDTYYLEDPYKQYDYSVDKAKALLDEAGWVVGSDGIREKDGIKLEFEVFYTATAVQAGTAILIMTPVFKEAGIVITPKQPDDSTMNSMWDTHEFVMLNSGTTMGPNPARYQYIWGGIAANNIMLYEDQEMQDLFKQGDNALDAEEQRKIYEQIQNKLSNEVVNIPLWYRHTIYAYTDNLNIDEAGTMGYVHFRFAHMDKLYLED